MAIVGGLDIHRRQITYDYLDTDSGETRRGQLSPATRLELRAWLARFTGQQADFALEATTGWRFVAEELTRAGCAAHLAEPADTRALRGPKRRAKTDRTDAHHLRELLRAGTLPESWMPPVHIADARTQVRLRRALVGERTGWYQRIHAILFHHGLPERSQLLTADGRAWLARAELPVVARQAVELALRMIDHLEVELDTLDTQLAGIARAQPGCQALMGRYGIGWLTAVAIWAEFGDVRRFANSRQAVRFCGLDITITESDGKRARGHLARQGSPVLRWALHEAAMCAARPSSPDHPYYLQVKQRLGGKRAALSVARKLAREAYHTLRALGDQALVPAELPPPPDQVGDRARLGAPGSLMWCGQLPDAPVATRRGLTHALWAASIERAAAPASCGNPITHHVAGHRSEHRDKAGRPRVTLPAVHFRPRGMR